MKITNLELKQKWIDALRSGEYKQGGGRLHHKNKFCCLGVLCEVANLPNVEVKKEGFNYSYNGAMNIPPVSVTEALFGVGCNLSYYYEVSMSSLLSLDLGLDDNAKDWLKNREGLINLYQLNDSGHFTFEMLADIIEKLF